MNRCTQCWGDLTRDHRCHFNWRRLIGEIAAIAFGGGLGAFAHLMVEPAAVPAMGAIIGAVVFSAVPHLVFRVSDDLDWRRSDVIAGRSDKRRV